MQARRGTPRGAGTPWPRRIVALGVGGALAVGLALSGMAHAGHGHPAKIHDGMCDRLGAVAFTLNGVGANENQHGTPIATPETVNPSTAYQMMIGQSTIDTSLDRLLKSDHALMLYDSDATMQGIACGNLGGARLGDELIVGLAELNTPGHVGVAVLRGDGDKTDVTIYVGHGLAPVSASRGTGGTPGAMPGMSGMNDMPGMDMGGAATPASGA